MFVIKVWNLPAQPEQELIALFKEIVEEAKKHPNLGIESEADMLCLFPADRMVYGSGTEILVEVGQRISVITMASFGKLILKKYPNARVICQSGPRYSLPIWDSKEKA